MVVRPTGEGVMMNESTVHWQPTHNAKNTPGDILQPVLVVYCGEVTTAGWNGRAFISESGHSISKGVTWFAKMPDGPPALKQLVPD